MSVFAIDQTRVDPGPNAPQGGPSLKSGSPTVDPILEGDAPEPTVVVTMVARFGVR